MNVRPDIPDGVLHNPRHCGRVPAPSRGAYLHQHQVTCVQSTAKYCRVVKDLNTQASGPRCVEPSLQATGAAGQEGCGGQSPQSAPQGNAGSTALQQIFTNTVARITL